MNYRKQIYDGQLRKNIEQKKLLEDLRFIKRNKVQKEQKGLYIIDKHINNIENTISIYQQVDEDKLNELSDEEFNEFIYPLQKYPSFHEQIAEIKDQTHKEMLNEDETYGVFSSISYSTAATPTQTYAVAIKFESVLRDSQIIYDKRKQEYEFEGVELSLNYIMTALPSIVPDISKKFEEVVNVINSRKPNTPTCGELVNLRTLIYNELYRNRGRIKDKVQAIKVFIFGSNRFSNIADGLITEALRIWDAISGDIKNGKSSDNYNNMIFTDLILNMKEIIEKRNHYFRR